MVVVSGGLFVAIIHTGFQLMELLNPVPNRFLFHDFDDRY